MNWNARKNVKKIFPVKEIFFYLKDFRLLMIFYYNKYKQYLLKYIIMNNEEKIKLEKSYLKIDKKIDDIIKKTWKYLKNCGNFDENCVENEIKKAYIFAKNAHEGQMRLSGDPYIIHPVEATEILLSLHPDIYTIQACLLHDVVEDTEIELDEIEEVFWKDVAFLCAWMEKLSWVRYKWIERDVGSLRKMFIAMAEDLRVVFIKLSDRIHNMKTLKFHPKREKQIKIATETLNIYAPIADRLGLFWFKNILEEECFKILHKKEYSVLKKELRELKKGSKLFLQEAEEEIKTLLDWENIKKYKIDYRVKSIYSIYKKMKKKWLEEASWLYDLFWIRVIVNNVEECYRTLWVLHNKWAPLPNRFKDYIALPKPNWYKALHTTVIWLLKKNKKQPAEIQIKTFEMMEYAEIWVAAHFEYKEKWSKIAKDINWVKDLKEITQNLENNDFVSSLKIDVFSHRIFVFTPNWDSINLPSWSTAIDFAYDLHSDLGDHISIAKVNWKIYPLDRELHNWDRVEIIVDKNRKPNPFWLSFVKTNKAKNRIKNFLKKEDKEAHRERWKEIMNKLLEKSGLWTFDKDLSILKIVDWTAHKIEDRLWLLEQIWNFSITPSSLMRKILKTQNSSSIQGKKKVEKPSERNIIKEKRIIVWWDKNLEYKIATCCKRKKLNKIVAHINSSSVISVHSRNCKILENVNKDRLLPAYIEWEKQDLMLVKIRLEFIDKIWILHSITQVLFNMSINISEIIQKTSAKWNKEIILTVEIKDYDYLIIDRLVDRLSLKLWNSLLEKQVLEIKG